MMLRRRGRGVQAALMYEYESLASKLGTADTSATIRSVFDASWFMSAAVLAVFLEDNDTSLRKRLRAKTSKVFAADVAPALEVMGVAYPLLRLGNPSDRSVLCAELGVEEDAVHRRLVRVYGSIVGADADLQQMLDGLADSAKLIVTKKEGPVYSAMLYAAVESRMFGSRAPDLAETLTFWSAICDSSDRFLEAQAASIDRRRALGIPIGP
jgi:hypothetical protein